MRFITLTMLVRKNNTQGHADYASVEPFPGLRINADAVTAISTKRGYNTVITEQNALIKMETHVSTTGGQTYFVRETADEIIALINA